MFTHYVLTQKGTESNWCRCANRRGIWGICHPPKIPKHCI